MKVCMYYFVKGWTSKMLYRVFGKKYGTQFSLMRLNSISVVSYESRVSPL